MCLQVYAMPLQAFVRGQTKPLGGDACLRQFALDCNDFGTMKPVLIGRSYKLVRCFNYSRNFPYSSCPG
jgi:hypothetical protein